MGNVHERDGGVERTSNAPGDSVDKHKILRGTNRCTRILQTGFHCSVTDGRKGTQNLFASWGKWYERVEVKGGTVISPMGSREGFLSIWGGTGNRKKRRAVQGHPWSNKREGIMGGVKGRIG